MWGMLAKVGLASDGSQPNTLVAWPLKKVKTMEQAEELDEINFQEAMDSLADKAWKVVPSFKDPDAATGGDMQFWTKPAIGRYQYTKLTMTFRDTTCKTVLDLCQGNDLKARSQYSAEIIGLGCLAKTDKSSLITNVYSAPKGVANRDFVILTAKRQLDANTMISYGCSVDSPMLPEHTIPVRAATQFCWYVVQKGNDVALTWINCFDPRGWTPQFLLTWMKSAAIKEFLNVRRVLAGLSVEVKATECDVSEEELEKARQEEEEHHKAAKK